MNMITKVELWKQTIEVVRIPRQLVKVDHGVEVPGSADPFIYRLPIGLILRAGMVVLESHEGHNRGADYFDPVRMGTRDHLLVSGNHAANHVLVFGCGNASVARQHSQVVHPFQCDYPPHSRLGEHIVIET